MQKVTLGFDEKLVYQRSLQFIIPDEMTEEKLDKELSRIEREVNGMSDFVFLLGKIGVHPLDYAAVDDYSSPHDSEIECTEYVMEE